MAEKKIVECDWCKAIADVTKVSPAWPKGWKNTDSRDLCEVCVITRATAIAAAKKGRATTSAKP
jgi:hypothetical protein